jgi:DNA replication protein DnaC
MRASLLKATEPGDRLKAAVSHGGTSRAASSLARPPCPVVDEVGRRAFDEACTNPFFDVVDRRCAKEGPNTMIMTSNVAASEWKRFFTGDNALPCALDRLFGNASAHVMRGPS